MSPVVLPSPDAGFRLRPTPLGTLVIPKHSKWNWTPEERRFRSAIVRDGRVVSSGWQKFGGADEPGFLGDVERLKAELARTGRVRLVEKIDGVLAIRSVVDGETVWRTRGTHDGGAHRESIERLVPDALRDPGLLPDVSILCELTDPRWRIVIEYERPALTLLGVIEHETSRPWAWDECRGLAERLGLEQPESSLWEGSWKSLVRSVSRRVGGEGVVVQSEDGATMVKLKTDAYRDLHRIRFVHEGSLLVDLWRRCEWGDEEEARKWLSDRGVDILHVPRLAERVRALCETGTIASSDVAALDARLLELQMRDPRSAVRTLRSETPEPCWPVLDLLADGREAAAASKRRNLLVEGLLEEWETVDEAVEEPT